MTVLRQTHLLAEAHRLLALLEQNQVWLLHQLRALSTHEKGHQRPELDT